CCEQVWIVAGDGLEHLGDEAVIGGETPADLSDEHLEALPPEKPGRLLLALRQRRCDRQEIADEQRQHLSDDGDIAVDDADNLVQLVEAPHQYLLDAWHPLW